MSIAFASTPTDQAADAAGAAVQQAIALFRVVGRIGRCVFLLGATATRLVNQARAEGRPLYADVGPIKVRGALQVVNKALLLVDALRWRLRTAELRRALRPQPADGPKAAQDVAKETAPRPKYARKVRWPVDMSDPMQRVVERRRHPEARNSVRAEIANLTDAEVVNYICTYLLTAAELMNDVETTRRIHQLVAEAAALFEGEDAENVVPRVCGALPPEDRVAAEAVAEAQGPAAPPDATGRGPP